MNDSDMYERVWDAAGEEEAAVIARAKQLTRAAVEDGLAALEPEIRRLRGEAARRFWVALGTELNAIFADTDGMFTSTNAEDVELWQELVELRERLADLQLRIGAGRSEGGSSAHLN
ncbi:MAG: hypothetical protein H0V12_07190 [Chloroflexi bacterium]|nr:hypothetical protein [Chloroflexota bacterium]